MLIQTMKTFEDLFLATFPSFTLCLEVSQGMQDPVYKIPTFFITILFLNVSLMRLKIKSLKERKIFEYTLMSLLSRK